MMKETSGRRSLEVVVGDGDDRRPNNRECDTDEQARGQVTNPTVDRACAERDHTRAQHCGDEVTDHHRQSHPHIAVMMMRRCERQQNVTEHLDAEEIGRQPHEVSPAIGDGCSERHDDRADDQKSEGARQCPISSSVAGESQDEEHECDDHGSRHATGMRAWQRGHDLSLG